MRVLAIIFLILFPAKTVLCSYTDKDIKAMIVAHGSKFDFIKKVANIASEACPIVMGQGFSIISVLPGSDRLIYVGEISFKGVTDRQLLDSKDTLLRKIADPAINRACTTPDSRSFADAGIVLEYRYYTPSGTLVYSYEVTKEKCAQIDAVMNR